jgi:hypothetical protein
VSDINTDLAQRSMQCCYCCPHCCCRQILDRKGFVRMAVESGTPLVPVYHFGNSKLFRWGAQIWLAVIAWLSSLQLTCGMPGRHTRSCALAAGM